MAKMKNKINNKMKNVDNKAKADRLKAKMKQQVEDCEYVSAMDTLAEIVTVNGVDIDSMYLGAYCYLMTGDNERSVKWVNNILKLDQNNVKARILLGRICIMEDRNEDALNIFEFVLENMGERLTASEKEDLDELLDYYRYSDEEMMVNEYPYVAKFLGLSAEEDQNEEVESVEAIEEQKEQEPVNDAAERARNAVARLKALLNSKKEADAAAMAQEENVEPVQEACEEVTENVEDESEEDNTTEENTDFDVEAIAAQIMAKPVSLKEKIKLFNTFAAGCYVNGDYQNAFDLLNAALSLDSSDQAVLKNLAYVCAAAGEKEQAMEFASQLPMIDFGVLQAIK